jgi:hypothetical protein
MKDAPVLKPSSLPDGALGASGSSSIPDRSAFKSDVRFAFESSPSSRKYARARK